MKKATYHYHSFLAGELYPQSVRVDVVSDSAPRTIRIRLRGWHADGRGPGTLMTVQKHKVVIDEPATKAPGEPIREIRKPYKDD